MHSLIASRLTQQYPDDTPRDAGDVLEIFISRLSRLSGYAAMGAALIGIALLVF